MKLLITIALIVGLTCCKEPKAGTGSFANSDSSKDTCDNPDAPITCSFRDMPLQLTNTMEITDAHEEGEKLIITGRILKPDSTPFSDVMLYAYHTAPNGLYTKDGTEGGAQKWHGRLHGWCKTDSKGEYKINTIKPGPYPDNTLPAHIHMAVKKPDGSKPAWISDFVFEGDPLINERYLKNIQELPGGTGIVKLTLVDGILIGNRDIIIQ